MWYSKLFDVLRTGFCGRYYSSGGDDEITLRENRRAYQRIYFKPRVLVGVANIDLQTTICGSWDGCKSFEEAPKNSAGDWSTFEKRFGQ